LGVKNVALIKAIFDKWKKATYLSQNDINKILVLLKFEFKIEKKINETRENKHDGFLGQEGRTKQK
jgi:hypothetical protein